MNILIFANKFLPYSQTFIYNQIKSMPKDVNIIVLCLKKINKNIFPWGKVYCLPKHTFFSLFINFCSILKTVDKKQILQKYYYKKINRIIKKEKIDLIHVHFGNNLFYFNNSFLNIPIPIIVTFHGYDATVKTHDEKYREELIHAFAKNNIYGIAVSAAIKDNVCSIGINHEKIFVHYIGIDLSYFKRKDSFHIEEREVKLLQIGRFVQKKGHYYTIFALEKLLLAGYHAHIEFIGDGFLQNEIKSLVEEKNLGNYVSFVGVLNSEKVRERLIKADILLQPSISADNGDKEGLPISIMEAMAVGLPIVATYHSGIPELVRNGIDGYLFPEKDIDGYCNALCTTISNYHLFEKSRMSYVNEKIDIRNNCKSLKDIYSHIIEICRYK